MFGDLFISGLRQSLNRVLGEGSGCELAFMVHFFLLLEIQKLKVTSVFSLDVFREIVQVVLFLW